MIKKLFKRFLCWISEDGHIFLPSGDFYYCKRCDAVEFIDGHKELKA